MNTKTKLPSPAVRNAIAFVDFYGDFPSHCHIDTRLKAQRFELGESGEGGQYVWVRFNEDRSELSRRFYCVTEEGRAIALKGSLAKALAFLQEEGFAYRGGHRSKPAINYIPDFEHEDGRTAWISGGEVCRVYVNFPRDHPEYKVGSNFSGEFRVG